MPFGMGPWELGIILIIVIIIFGVGKLPQIGGAIGQSIKEFKHASSEASVEKKTKDEDTNAEKATEKAS